MTALERMKNLLNSLPSKDRIIAIILVNSVKHDNKKDKNP